MMRRWAGGALVAALSFLPAPTAGLGGNESRPRVREVASSDATRVDIAFDGHLVDFAAQMGADGKRTIVVLVGPRVQDDAPDGTGDSEDAEAEDLVEAPAPPPCDEAAEANDRSLTLYRIDPERGDGVSTIRAGLPSDSTSLASIDIDGDGTEEIFLLRNGELLQVDERGTTSVVQDANLGRLDRGSDPGHGRAPWIAATPLGALRLYRPVAGATGWAAAPDVVLPIKGSVVDGGIVVTGSRPRFIGGGGDSSLLFATAAEIHSNRRLESTLIEILASGETESSECWGRLPDDEDVLEQGFLTVDGEPMLWVTTKPADKLSLFGEKRLRVFPLVRDRSRLGVGPILETQSRMNLWQSAIPRVLDVDGDGREDLVVGYWKGLKDDRVVLDVYRRDASGQFRESAVSTAFNVDNGDRSFLSYGDDLDGDSIPDLLLRGDGKLLLYPGRASRKGKQLVSKTPRKFDVGDAGGDDVYVVTMGTGGTEMDFGTRGAAAPRLVDLDGDGTKEILLRTAATGGAEGFSVLRMSPAP